MEQSGIGTIKTCLYMGLWAKRQARPCPTCCVKGRPNAASPWQCGPFRKLCTGPQRITLQCAWGTLEEGRKSRLGSSGPAVARFSPSVSHARMTSPTTYRRPGKRTSRPNAPTANAKPIKTAPQASAELHPAAPSPKSSPPAVYHPRDWPETEKSHWINAVCVWITEGKSLNSFVRTYPQGPSIPCWYDWLQKDASFAELYACARANAADTLAEETVDIADEVKDAGQMDSARVNAARLRVDARKWVASKLKPKVYADRIETVTSGHLTVSHSITDEDRAKALASIMAREAVKTAPNLLVAQRMIEGTAIDVTPETAPQTKPA